MTYDATDTDADGVIEADVDNEATTTDVLNNADHFVATSDDPQAVIDNADAGDTIVFLPGTHEHDPTAGTNSAIAYIGEPLEIYGPEGVDIKFADNSLGGSAGYHFRVGDGSTTIDGVKIHGGMTLDGNRANNTGPGVDATFLASGVFSHGEVSNLDVEGVTFKDIDGRPGVNVGDQAGNVNTTDIKYRNCVVDTCRGGFLGGHPDFDGKVIRWEVIEPTIKGTYWTASIEPNWQSEDVRIIGGTIDDCNKGLAANRGTLGLTIKDVEIRNITNDPEGVGAAGAAAALRTTSPGGSSSRNHTKVVVEGCTIDNTPSGVNGIDIENTDDSTTKDNVVRNCGGISVNVQSGGVATVRDSVLRDGADEFIKISNATKAELIANLCENNSTQDKDGIRVDSTVTEGHVLDNEVFDITGPGVSMVCPTQIFRKNDVYDTHLDSTTATKRAVQLVNGTTRTICHANIVYQENAASVDHALRLDNVSNGFASANVLEPDDFDSSTIEDSTNASFDIRHNEGYVTENSGEADISGDGSTTSFAFSHGMDEAPDGVSLTQETVTSAGEDIESYGAGASNITVNFTTAPANGETATVGFVAR